MTLYSIQTVPCPNDCQDGKIIVYNVYVTDDKGLPVGVAETCDVCKGKGYKAHSSQLPETH